jgi:FkbM family methyltransferase
MIANTRRLFAKLLRVLRIEAVCDVGSMDGADALIFRAALPHASVYAFEANPENYRAMLADTQLANRNIRLVPLAATNFDGEAEFFVVKSDHPNWQWHGMSSLYRRSPQSTLSSTGVAVKTTRLDTFIVNEGLRQRRLALWIDVEGKAHEALEGVAGAVERIYLLHVEVETTHCIGAGQKLYPQVKALLHSLGFFELARDAPVRQEQFNALFVRRGLPMGMRAPMYGWLALACLRRTVGYSLRKVGLGGLIPRRPAKHGSSAGATNCAPTTDR